MLSNNLDSIWRFLFGEMLNLLDVVEVELYIE